MTCGKARIVVPNAAWWRPGLGRLEVSAVLDVHRGVGACSSSASGDELLYLRYQIHGDGHHGHQRTSVGRFILSYCIIVGLIVIVICQRLDRFRIPSLRVDVRIARARAV